MNKKELSELSRRLRPDKSNIQRIYGCYVNSNKEIISCIDESIGLLSKEEGDKYIALLKKSLSGGIGKHLVNLSFETRQVVEGEEHKLLSALRSSALKDEELRMTFYKSIAESLNLNDQNYLILIAYDVYDVPRYGKDGSLEEDSSDVYTYIVCSVCPVKAEKSVLGYSSDESRFHSLSLNQIVAQPELGFLFPAFDDRSANIYSALFYSRDTKGVHSDFIDAVFKTEVPMSPLQQKETFGSALKDNLKETCSFSVVRSVHNELSRRIEAHKELKVPETLTITPDELGDILQESGIDADRCNEFVDDCARRFGEKAELTPENLVNTRKFEINTETVKISVDPAFTDAIKTRTIDGRKYILIPADGDVEINGISVKLDEQ